MAEHQAQLDWERRFSRPVAAAAIASAFAGIAAQVASAGAQARTGGQRANLIKLDANTGAAVAGVVLYALSVLLVAVVLLYLLRAVKYRRQEANIPAVGPLIMLAPLLVAVGSILIQLDVNDIAKEFTDSGPQTERRADRLLEDRTAAPAFMGLAGNIALGFGFVVTCLNAMRSGLLTRFMGIIGVIVGALYVLPIPGAGMIVQTFWLGAMAAILFNVWPGGRGEAWETGEAGIWLSAAEQRRNEMRAEREREQGGAPAVEPPPEEPEAPEERSDHPVSKKRRKKRRR